MPTSLPPAPPISLTACVSGRELRFGNPGVVTLLLCMSQETQKQAETLEEAVRGRWPSAADVLVAYVIDLRKVPGMLRRIAEGMLEAEYQRSVAILPAGCSGDDYVVMLPDWQGEALRALDVDLDAIGLCSVVVTADGRIAGKLSAANSPGGNGSDMEVADLIEKALTA